MKRFSLIVVPVFAVAWSEDFEYSTGGAMGTPATIGGSAGGWEEWFITSVGNDTGQDLIPEQLGFPCCGPASRGSRLGGPD
ncbi:MAG: hypothetical protein AVO35_03315 [Candidatus Aegiribacteria sp. MLS_C]|nr:MAG: hypothetical protein AVO35_03315 [Candidatus Aegiribacteria sp. MLS_C]